LALSHLSKCGHLRKFLTEDSLFNQRDRLDHLFVILDGVVGFTVDFGLERPSWLYVAGPGSIVDLGIYSDPPISPVTALPLSDVKTIAFPRQCWLQELSNQPDLAMEMKQRQNERLGLIGKLGVMLRRQEAPVLARLAMGEYPTCAPNSGLRTY